MAIWNCEFCNAYVTDFEVHYCRNFGNQHRQSSATLPRSSSADLVQDVDSRSALPMNYGAGWPGMDQINSSAQQNVLPNIRSRTSCEETATAEIPYPYGNANQNQYHPETSDFVFANMAYGQENPSKSPLLTVSDQNNPMHVAEPCLLPGFQEAFGQGNALMNQLAQPPNASSRMECSGIIHTDETSSQFISDFNEGVNASTILISQHHETSSGIPILDDRNARYNPLDPVPPTDASGAIHSNNCSKEFLPEDHLEPRELFRSVLIRKVCNYCDRTFSRSSHLTTHMRTHTGDKPYACTMCNKRFAHSSSLTRHKHTHTGDKPYACKICNKRFADSSTLTKHKRIHTGEKPYACQICNKRFAHNFILTNHIRTHTGEKPYKCTECDRKFSTNSLLKRHMLQHAGEQMRKCDSCGAEFASEDSLAAHKCKKNK